MKKVKILSDEEIKQMRAELENERFMPGTPPPKGREYWDCKRIVKTIEHLKNSKDTELLKGIKALCQEGFEVVISGKTKEQEKNEKDKH